jgi:alpha-ribazole phosphatase
MIIAIRHGPVAADGLCYGRWNPPLRNRPDADARIVLDRVAHLSATQHLAFESATDGFFRIVTSPADRCRQLAACLAEQLHLVLQDEPRIAELSMGEWEGQPWAQIEQHDGERLRLWMEHWQTAAPPDGESLADLESRVRAAYDASATGGPALWVTHAGVIRALRVLLHGTPWTAAMESPVPHLTPELLVGGR